jgi:hypothetical protein
MTACARAAVGTKPIDASSARVLAVARISHLTVRVAG